MPNYIVVPIILFVVIGLYIWSYKGNKNTEAPEGIVPESKCSSCGSGSCSFAGTNNQPKDDECEIEILK